MSDLTDFLNNAADEFDASAGTVNLVVNSTTIPVVWNQYSYDLIGADGGLAATVAGTAMAQAADVTSPKTLEGLSCTVDGTAFRIENVTIGDVAVTFAMVDPNAVS